MSRKNTLISTPKKPALQDWHKADIICGLWKRGTSVHRLSRENNYKSGSLALALRTPWPKAERIIATALGVPPQEIWPSRYHPDGSPRSGRGERGLGRGAARLARYKKKGSTGPRGVNVHQPRAA